MNVNPQWKTPRKKRKRSKDGGWSEARLAALRRSGGRCVVQLAGCDGWANQVHHILRRSQGGGHDDANLLAVCLICHGWIHDHPESSYERGFLKRGEA